MARWTAGGIGVVLLLPLEPGCAPPPAAKTAVAAPRSVDASAAATPPAAAATPSGPEPAPLDAGESSPAAEDRDPLRARSLPTFATLEKACDALGASSDSMILRGEPGLHLDTVRTRCTARPPLPRGPAQLLELRRTTRFPRHADVDSLLVAPAFHVGSRWAVPLASVSSDGSQSMARGDASGRVELVSADLVDVVGTEVPELILTFAKTSGDATSTRFVVCDARAAWCTEPALLDQQTVDAPPLRGTRTAPPETYAFRRHERGVLVVPSGTQPYPERVYPLDLAPSGAPAVRP